MYATLAILAMGSLAAAQTATSSPASAAASPSTTAAPAANLPDSVSPEQSSAILAGLSSYNGDLERDSVVGSLGNAINTWLPIGSWDAWNAQGFANAPRTTDWLALATATPTYSYPPWATYLPGSLQSQFGAFATSVQVARESIVRSALSIADRSDLPGPTAGVVTGPIPTANDITVNTIQGMAAPTGAPAAVLGAAAGLAGLAALVL